MPGDAVIVAPDGDDAAPGTVRRPLRSIATAVARAGEGGTVVVREGVWHESVHLDTRGVTLRSWPGERVWLDGSIPLDPGRFAAASPRPGIWRMDGYGIRLDTSPTFTRGAPDNTEPGWRFVDPRYPLAADPQQIWAGDRPLRQVEDLDSVSGDSFHVDTDTRTLHVGVDPAGPPPAAGAITKALLITAPEVRVEGIGIRRYVPSLPDFGAVTVSGPGSRLTDLLVTGSSTIGVSVQTHDVTLERVTVHGSGMLGVHAHRADSLRLLDVEAVGNNTRRFNAAPSSAGAKITMTRGLRVEGGSYSGNRGNGLWLDESVVDTDVVGVDATDNLEHGIQIELCAGVDVLRAVVARNGAAGVSVQNSGHVRIWNATAVANRRQVAFVQDGRRPTDAGAHQRLLAGSDGLPTWVIGSSEMVNSVLSDSAGSAGDGPVGESDTLFAVEDYTRSLDANSLDIRLRHNLYLSDTRTGRRWTHVWTRPGDDPSVFTSLRDFRAATGQEAGSRSTDARRFAAALAGGADDVVAPAPAIGEALAPYLPADPEILPAGTVGAGRPVPAHEDA